VIRDFVRPLEFGKNRGGIRRLTDTSALPHLRTGVSGNDFAGHEVGARRRLAPTEHAVNQRWGADGELWQPRFFDRALRTVKEYNEKVEYIHLDRVRAGLVSRPEDGRWSSYNEYAGMSADEQDRTLRFDRRPRENALRSARTNLIAPSRGRKDLGF